MVIKISSQQIKDQSTHQNIIIEAKNMVDGLSKKFKLYIGAKIQFGYDIEDFIHDKISAKIECRKASENTIIEYQILDQNILS